MRSRSGSPAMASVERCAKSLVDHVAERVRFRIGGVDLALFGREARDLATRRVLDDLVILVEAHAHLVGDVRVARLAADLGLELADRVRHGARLAMHRARRPVELAQPVEHRAADTDAGVSLETRAASGRIVGRRLEQAEHAGLDEVVDFHRRRQSAGQVIGDALHQLGMAHHQLLGFPGAGALAVSAHSCHRTTSRRTDGRLIRRSTKNSTFPRGPSATGHISALSASVLSAMAAGQDGYAAHNGTLFTD